MTGASCSAMPFPCVCVVHELRRSEETGRWRADLSALDWPDAVLSVLVVGAPFLLIERLSWDLRDPLGLVFVLGTLIREGRKR
jgi:hypothetical protein